MTDEQMDARLRAAGRRWRETTDGDMLTAQLPDLDEELPPQGPRRRRTWFVAAAAAAVVALIAGLTFALRGEPRHAPPNAETAGLQGVVWAVRPSALASNGAATLFIGRDGTLVADDECRLIGAHATLSGDRLTVTHLVVRYKPCTDQYGTGFYDKGTNVLRGPASYTVGTDGLTITRPHVGSLHFAVAGPGVVAPSLDVPTLTDTTWRAPSGKTLRIDAGNGTVSGTFCAGRARVAGPTVHFTDCAPTGQGAYLATISGATLTLEAQSIDPGFSGMPRRLTFQWQPADPSIIDPATVTGRTWALESVGGLPASSGSLQISGSTAAIDDGCRTMARAIRVHRGSFSLIGAPPSHACSPQALTVDSFLSNDPASWVVRDGKLIVYGGGSQTNALVYGAAVQTTTSPLAGAWTLAKVFDASGAVRPATAPATLRVAADGTVTGTDGCRTFTGTVSTNGGTATFQLTMPEPGCSPAIEQTASLVDKVLSGPVTFIVASDVLIISKNELGRLSFTGKAVGGQDPQLLTTHDWQITTITYGTGHFRNGAPATDGGLLTFTAHGYELQHSCSIVHGSAQLAPGSMLLGQQRSDGHSCPLLPERELRAQSVQAIDTILTGKVAWSVSGSLLTLTGNGGTLVAVGGIRSDLTDSTWRLIATSHGNLSRSAVGIVTLSFPANDRLQVDRCYTSGAFVAVGDSSLTVFRLHTTLARPCPSGPPGTQEQNQTIDHVLTSEPLWSIVDNTLTLTGGEASLTFRR